MIFSGIGGHTRFGDRDGLSGSGSLGFGRFLPRIDGLQHLVQQLPRFPPVRIATTQLHCSVQVVAGSGAIQGLPSCG